METGILFLFFICLYFLLVWKSGKNMPIVYLFLFTYYVQYIFSVHLMYHEFPALGRQMPISQERLFEFLIPAFLSLFAGVFLFNREIDLSRALQRVNPVDAARLGNLLLVISLFVDVLSFLSSSFNSIQSFTVPLRYGALMCYLFRLSTRNIILVSLIFLTLIAEAITIGIFIEFFIWSTIFFFFISCRYQISIAKRSLLVLIAIPLIVTIQSVKKEYRRYTWKGKKEAGIGLLTDLAIKKQLEQDESFIESDGMERTIGRLNHGWHVAKVLNRVPSRVPFANGKEMLTDLEGILLPRILFPSKKLTGDHMKFEYYTGHKIKRTSMTVGVFGDFYINYGVVGAIFGLFIFGAIVARLLFWFTNKFVIPDPVNVVWIPILFSYLVRADNDFYTVVNSAFKGFLIFLALRYVYGLIWNRHLSQPTR
jgi:hypothetical protein